MSDEASKLILADTAISAIEQSSTRRRRRRERQSPALTNCENCTEPLHGHWCAQCGQPAVDYRRSFGHVIADVLESFLNWDSKIFATIGWLIVRPWRLTNEFLAGHRVRYLHPLRLYLLASIVFFFAATYGVKSHHFDPINLSSAQRAEIRQELAQEDIAPEIRSKVEQALGGIPISARKRAELEAKLKEPELPADERTRIEERLAHGDLPPNARAKFEEAMKNMPPEARAKVNQAVRKWPEKPVVFEADKSAKSDSFDKWLETRAREKFGEHGTNIQLFLVTLMSNLPYMMFACIPLFAFVLKLLYIRRRIFYIDHLVYALHIHSFAYIAVMLIILITVGLNRTIPGIFAGWIIAALWFTFAVQVFLSIRRVYRQGWFFTVFKFFLGGLAYLIVLSLALAVTFFITIVLP